MYLQTTKIYNCTRELLRGLYNGDTLQFYGSKNKYTIDELRNMYEVRTIHILKPKSGRKLTLKLNG